MTKIVSDVKPAKGKRGRPRKAENVVTNENVPQTEEMASTALEMAENDIQDTFIEEDEMDNAIEEAIVNEEELSDITPEDINQEHNVTPENIIEPVEMDAFNDTGDTIHKENKPVRDYSEQMFGYFWNGQEMDY